MRPNIMPCFVLVDLNNQFHRYKLDSLPLTESACKLFLSQFSKRLCRIASGLLDQEYLAFRVFLRLYYGWHKGYQPTPARRIFDKYIDYFNQFGLGHSRIFSGGPICFGDTLIGASEYRLIPRAAIHLANTYRERINDPGVFGEKMVDAALITDLLWLAHNREPSTLLVFSDDDDIIPALIVSAKSCERLEKRLRLIRSTKKRSNNKFFITHDLEIDYEY